MRQFELAKGGRIPQIELNCPVIRMLPLKSVYMIPHPR
jgi:hypothetical protein